jgi:SOS-response transcriptional repressor LexA
MNNIAERIRQRRKDLGLTQTELAQAVGCGQGAINNYESGARDNPRDLLELATALKVNPQWLKTGEGAMDSLAPVSPQIKVPLISWAEAKNWKDTIESLEPGVGEQILVTYEAKQYTYALRVKDDMNEPKFPINSWLVIEPEEEPVHQKWCIVDEGGDEATCKQLVIDGATRYLRSDNARFPIKEMKQNAKFCGTVKQLIVTVN